MIRDICFKSSERVDLGSVEGRECAGIASADIDQDLSPEIIICCLNGDVAVYKNGKSFLSLPGLGSSNLCAFQVLDKFASRKSASGCSAAIFQLFCNGTLCITTFESRASGSGDTSVPSVVPHRMTSAVTFPRNATSIESFCLVDGRRILIVCSCSEMHVYKYDDATEVFDHFTTLAIESDVNSVDFIDGHFLLLGLKSGGVLIYDLCVKSKFSRSNSVSSAVSFEVTEKTADLALLRVHVIDGCEPPLSRLSISSAFVEASVQGYVATTVMPPNTERGGLSARSMDSVESQSGLLRSTVHFAVAWADGRICLCDVIELDEEDDFLELEDTSPLEIVKSRKYAWKAVKCVQTGLCLFSIVCVHLQKHVEFDIRRTVVSGDDVLCIAAARTGQTFFVSNSDYSDYRNEDGARHLERDAMPRTVCCFESSILLGAPAVSRDSASASCSASAIEAIVKSIFTSGNCVMIQSFTASYRLQERPRNLVVANAVTEFSVKNIIASTAHIGEGSPPCITPNAITDGNSHTTVGAIAVTDVVNIGAGIALGQVLVADDDKEEDAAMIAVMAEVAHVEPIVPTLEMSLWYLTSDGSLMCIPNVDSQFLSFGAGLTCTRVEGRDIDFIKETLIKWMLAPDHVSFDFGEELMDLVFEYFKNLADVLTEAINCGSDDLNKVINDKTVAEHMAIYFLDELSVLPTQDIVNFTKDLRDLVNNCK